MEQIFDAIADGLVDNQYAIVDDFIVKEEVDAILNEDHFQHYQQYFKKAGIGKQGNAQINEAIRGDFISWIDPQTALPSTQVYLLKLKNLIQFLNRALFLSLKEAEVHQTVYPIGSYYKRHLDQFKKDDARKLSVILYLNKSWQEQHGGQLRIYTKENSIDVLPIAGRLVCFRSDALEHEVLPATRERLSITGWILDREKI